MKLVRDGLKEGDKKLSGKTSELSGSKAADNVSKVQRGPCAPAVPQISIMGTMLFSVLTKVEDERNECAFYKFREDT